MKHRLKYLQKSFARGEINADKFRNSLMSYLGMLQHCDSYQLKRKLLGAICLQRKGVKNDESYENDDGGIFADDGFGQHCISGGIAG